MSAGLGEARRLLARARCIVSFSGAGLSAESGVPTFRDAASGALWAKYDPMRLASAEGFAADPRLVIEWYAWRRRLIAAATPNPAHRALASRADVAHVTQNVDDLLHRAGAAKVVQLHGTIARDRCQDRCGFEEPVDLTKPPAVRRCACGAYLRPSVVWFGEALPMEGWQEAERACTACDMLLVIGTSAVVHPAAGLIDVARAGGAAIISVNTHPSDAGAVADVELIGMAGATVPALLAP